MRWRLSENEMNRGAKTLFALFSLLVLYACSFSPRYERPAIEIPNNWRVESNEREAACNIRWWQQLNDPVLDDLIAEALERNNDLKVATARIAQYRAQLGVVSSQLYPQLYAQTSVSRMKSSRTMAGDQIFSNSNGGNTSYGDGYQGGGAGGNGAVIPDLSQLFPVFSNDDYAVLNAAYELDLWGKIRSATDASYADLLGQEEARKSVMLSLISSVASSYLLLRQYDWQLEISRQTARSRQQSYELATVRFNEGLTSELEVFQSLADLEQAMIQIIEFETLISITENLISVLIGSDPHTINRGLPVEGWQLPPDIPVGLPVDLLEQRPDIAQAEQLLIAANYRIGQARALYFPDITLTGSSGYASSQLHRLFTDPSITWQWMANLLQPIFTGWKITSGVDLAKAQKEEAVYRYIEIVLNALREVNDSLIHHENAKKVVKVEKKRVYDLQQYLHLATLQYDNGLVDYLNVLDAERRLFIAQLDLAREEAQVFITLVNVYKALGGGWVVDAEKLMTPDCDTMTKK